MTNEVTAEIGHLRTLAVQVELRSALPPHRLNQAFMRAEGLALAHPYSDSLLTIRQEGAKAFDALCECLAQRSPQMPRGAAAADLRSELFNVLREQQGRDPASIGADEAHALHVRFEAWFAERCAPRRVFVACNISPWAAPRFRVGPVTFVFVDDAARSDLYPPAEDPISRMGFDDLLALMKSTKSDWLACVAVEGCDQKRSEGSAISLSIWL